MFDDDKITNGPYEITCCGIRLESRYGKQAELSRLADTVEEALGDDDRRCIRAVFCDSKATHTYTVEFRSPAPRLAVRIGKIIEGYLIAIEGGHNGIALRCGDFDLGDLGPHWCDEDCNSPPPPE
jgi:hypothetical protein